MSKREIDVAQHEAAHVVVGVALGLKIREAVLKNEDMGNGWIKLGHVWFDWRGQADALVLATAAGIAWDRAQGHRIWSSGDPRILYELGVKSRRAIDVHVKAASALLTQLGIAHDRVSRALVERDIGGSDIEKLARGEYIEPPAD